MVEFQIDDMTCGHCVSTITRQIRTADPQAEVAIDLDRHHAGIRSQSLSAERVRALIEDAGFSPVLLAAGPTGRG